MILGQKNQRETMPEGAKRRRARPRGSGACSVPSRRRRRCNCPGLLLPPHSRRALPQRVLASPRYSQVQRLREVGGLAGRLLHGSLGGALHHQQGPRQRLLLPHRCTKAQGTQEGRFRQGNRAPMEHESSPSILKLMQYVPRYLCIKRKDNRSPEEHSGATFLSI